MRTPKTGGRYVRTATGEIVSRGTSDTKKPKPPGKGKPTAAPAAKAEAPEGGE